MPVYHTHTRGYQSDPYPYPWISIRYPRETPWEPGPCCGVRVRVGGQKIPRVTCGHWHSRHSSRTFTKAHAKFYLCGRWQHSSSESSREMRERGHIVTGWCRFILCCCCCHTKRWSNPWWAVLAFQISYDYQPSVTLGRTASLQDIKLKVGA